MNTKFFALAVALVIGASASLAQAQTATYDPATGNLTFNNLANVGGLQIKGPGVPRAGTTPDSLGGFADTSIPNEVSWLFFSPKNGAVDTGNLFPLNLMQTEIEANYFAGFVVSGSGNSVPISAPISGGLAIPEPATMALAGLSLLGLVVRRRNG